MSYPTVHAIVSGLLFAIALFITFMVLPRTSPSNFSTRKIARLGVLLSASLILGLIESFIPPLVLPGMRIGLANIAILLVLYIYGPKEGFLVAMLKAVLVGLLRGSLFSMGGYMALAGTFLSFVVMALLHFLIKKMSIVGISLAGSLTHVLGQIGVAYLFLGEAILGYLPWLLLIAFITGILIGLTSGVLLKRTRFVSSLR